LLSLLFNNTAVALIGFALVGAGFSTGVPIVFTATGNVPGVAPGVALSSVTTVGYLGFLIGPPLIGFAAELMGLRLALGIIAATSFLTVILAATVRPAPETKAEFVSASA
jgi:MFS family permease